MSLVTDRRRYGMKPYMGEGDRLNKTLADSLLNLPTLVNNHCGIVG